MKKINFKAKELCLRHKSNLKMRHQPEHNLKALEQIQEARIWLEPAYLDAGKNVKTLCQKHAPSKSDLLELWGNIKLFQAIEPLRILQFT